MSEKVNKTKKICMSSKKLLEVLREKNPLNTDYWGVKNELTLGECILIFYDIEPIPSLSHKIDKYIFSTVFEYKRPQKIDSRELIEEIFSSENALVKEIFKTDLPKEMTELEFILRIDKEKLCNRFINRWAKTSKKHDELSCFLEKLEKHRDHNGNPIYHYFSDGIFTLVSECYEDQKKIFLPTSSKDNFGNLFLIWKIDTFDKFPITIEKENFDKFDFKWFEFREINLESDSKENNEVECEYESKKKRYPLIF